MACVRPILAMIPGPKLATEIESRLIPQEPRRSRRFDAAREPGHGESRGHAHPPLYRYLKTSRPSPTRGRVGLGPRELLSRTHRLPDAANAGLGTCRQKALIARGSHSHEMFHNMPYANQCYFARQIEPRPRPRPLEFGRWETRLMVGPGRGISRPADLGPAIAFK